MEALKASLAKSKGGDEEGRKPAKRASSGEEKTEKPVKKRAKAG